MRRYIDRVTSLVLSVNPERQGARPRRGAAVLGAATRLFARFGFDKTSIDEIAREAGVSKGAVYRHWPSKDALFEATLVREYLRFLDDVHGSLDAETLAGPRHSSDT